MDLVRETLKLATLFLIAVTITALAYQAPRQPHLGINTGSYAKYVVTTSTKVSSSNDSSENITKEGSYLLEFQVIEVDGTNVIVNETQRDLKGTIILSRVFTGDPTRIIHSSYLPGGLLEHDINIFLVPADLGPGDNLPDSVYFPDKNDSSIEYPRWQRFNDSLNVVLDREELPHSTVIREANHFKWSKNLEYTTFSYVEQREAFYDSSTGILLNWSYSLTKIYRYVGFPPRGSYNMEVSWKMLDSSILAS